MSEQKKKVALIVVALGLWLCAVTLTFIPESAKMFYSDLFSGFILILLGIISLAPHRNWSGWTVGILGVWLQFAPLVFWASSSLNYLNDTFVGVVLIALSFLLTNSKEKRTVQPLRNPLGWSFNPSQWNHRIPTVGLALLCWFFSRYMAAYQLGYIDHVWDPIFQNGTLNVITSKISRDFPVSDAGLGALCYTIEAILGWQGGEDRWYRMPWLVLMFGFLVVPVGAVSITLIILQPVAVGSWCAWCLATAASMLIMILLTAPEFVAAIQFLVQSVKKGKSFWNVLWRGDTPPASKDGNRQTTAPVWGVTVPWNLVATAIFGVWLMVSPALFKTAVNLGVVEYVAGPLMIAFSVVSMAEVFRAARFVNLLLGIALIGAFWIWSEAPLAARLNIMGVGIAVLCLTFRRGRVKERYGTWDRSIF